MTDLPAAFKYWPEAARDKYREVEAIGMDDSRIPLGAPTLLWIRMMAIRAAEHEIELMKEATKP